MEHFYPHVWFLTSVCLAWILTVTSPSKASSSDQPPATFVGVEASLTTSSPMSSVNEGQQGDKCCVTGCCLNDGVCFPSSDFCQCTKQFYGYRCEKRRMRPCGPINHLQWAKVGCNLCRCFDSSLLCMSHVYSGCDGKPSTDKVDLSDYPDDITIFPMNEPSSNNIDRDYNGDNIVPDMKETNSSDNTVSRNTQLPIKTIPLETDVYYYNYGDSEEEENNLSNNSNPSHRTTYLTVGGYHWIFILMCLAMCLFQWNVNADIYVYFIS